MPTPTIVPIGSLQQAVDNIVAGEQLVCQQAGTYEDVILRKVIPDGSRVDLIGKPGAKFGRIRAANGAKNWLVRTVDARGIRRSPGDQANLIYVDSTCSKISFLDCTAGPDESVDLWSEQDWCDRGYPLLVRLDGTSINFTGTEGLNADGTPKSKARVWGAVSLVGLGAEGTANNARTLFQDVMLEEFGNDAMTLGGSNQMIQRLNIRRGRHSALQPLHADAIQGGYKQNRGNVTIQYVTIDMQDTGDSLQGITWFDRDGFNVKVLDCDIRCLAPHAIALAGIDGVEVARCNVRQRPDGLWSHIQVSKAKDASTNLGDGQFSTGVSIHDNTAELIRCDNMGDPTQVSIVNNLRANGTASGVTAAVHM